MIVEMKDIYKSFGKNHVLQGVDFKLGENEIHALVGEMCIRDRASTTWFSPKFLSATSFDSQPIRLMAIIDKSIGFNSLFFILHLLFLLYPKGHLWNLKLF